MPSLKDLFCNQIIEFDFDLNSIKILFSELKISIENNFTSAISFH